jgi:nucleotide-binding universal stress UspA family protein
MSTDERPVIAAFDGSPPSQAAVREAAALFGHRRIVVVTVWEPGMAMALMSAPDVAGTPYAPPSREEIESVDRIRRDHATSVAEAGAELARSLGATAEPLVVGDDADIADTLEEIASEQDAAVIVVGSRGLGAVKARLMGSTSRRLLSDGERPVLVVRTHSD